MLHGFWKRKLWLSLDIYLAYLEGFEKSLKIPKFMELENLV